MTLGEKIKEYRKQRGMSQEQLAERLNVSRQAITKWETDGGIPELNNLLALCKIFGISLDELASNQGEASRCCPEFEKICCDIELRGWNDGAYGVMLVGEDKDFLFYVKKEKTGQIVGAIGKQYISLVKKLKEQVQDVFEDEKITRDYFCGKSVTIELAKDGGVIAGFFDFKDDDYQNVVIESVSEENIVLQFGQNLSAQQITKIEELIRN